MGRSCGAWMGFVSKFLGFCEVNFKFGANWLITSVTMKSDSGGFLRVLREREREDLLVFIQKLDFNL